MTDKKLSLRDISCIRSDLAGGAGLGETFNKYVSAGFDDKRVADIVSTSPSKNFIDKHKIFLGIFKLIFFLALISGMVTAISGIDFDNTVVIGISAFALILMVTQIYLIVKNYFWGYFLTIASYAQQFPSMLKQSLPLGDLENGITLALQLFFPVALIYILIKMFPYANWRGKAKVSDGAYTLQSDKSN